MNGTQLVKNKNSMYNKNMFLIDFEKIGNVAKLYFGKDKNFTGDDWNDRPYDCNAGRVYDEYILGSMEIMVPFQYSVLEPKEPEYLQNNWSMDDIKERKCPALVIYKNEDISWTRQDDFGKAVLADDSVKLYLGDDMEEIGSKLHLLDENIKVINVWMKEN